MRINADFAALRRLVADMGAERSAWQLGAPRLSDLEVLRAELEEWKEIPLGEVENAGGLLSYKGEQVVLYIMNTRQDRDTLLYDKKNARRFHVAECRTLDRMREEGRFERYVVTTRKTGRFLVTATDRHTNETEELEAELGPCINCLMKLGWQDFGNLSKSLRDEIWEAFSIEDFFAEYSTFFHSKPTYTDETAPNDCYVAGWSKLSKQIREERGWRCEQCNVDLHEHQRLLHCHHINGVISDNRRSNIQALCILCHSEQPLHSQLRPKPSDRRVIDRLRILQKM